MIQHDDRDAAVLDEAVALAGLVGTLLDGRLVALRIQAEGATHSLFGRLRFIDLRGGWATGLVGHLVSFSVDKESGCSADNIGSAGSLHYLAFDCKPGGSYSAAILGPAKRAPTICRSTRRA